MSFEIGTQEEYRQVLAEIRRLRERQDDAENKGRLAEFEAAAASYAERHRGDNEKGRPSSEITGTSRA